MMLLPAFTHAPETNRVYNVDAMTLLKAMPDQSVNCIVTSPPYFGLRDYGVPGQIGLERTPAEYVARLVELFREARRVLRDDGTFWLNLGDTYTGGGRGDTPPLNTRNWKQGTNNGSLINQRTDVDGLPAKSLIGIPWRVAFGLQDDGWILRSDIIWHKPNPMPESVTDRPTKAHEYLFLFAKSGRYYYDADAIAEPATMNRWGGDTYKPANGKGSQLNVRGLERERSVYGDGTRNKRSVWTVATEPTPYAHFATFPTKLIEPCILAGCPVGGVVYDPFMGSGTTARVAFRWGRQFIGSEINAEYIAIHDRLIKQVTPDMFATMEVA